MKKVIGVTGSSGAGKTTLLSMYKNEKCLIIDCDKVSHKVLNTPYAKEKLVNTFGSGILSNGKIERKLLGKIAFSSLENTEKLNGILLPLIFSYIEKQINESKKEIIILDAPTLFESGLNKICSKTVALISDENIRAKRIKTRDNITDEYLSLRMKAGKSDDFFKANADVTLENNGDINEVFNKFSKIIKRFTEE